MEPYLCVLEEWSQHMSSNCNWSGVECPQILPWELYYSVLTQRNLEGLKDLHTYSRVALSNSEGRFSSISCIETQRDGLEGHQHHVGRFWYPRGIGQRDGVLSAAAGLIVIYSMLQSIDREHVVETHFHLSMVRLFFLSWEVILSCRSNNQPHWSSGISRKGFV
jgi:hypothetical protein